jgi:hypothetical protein
MREEDTRGPFAAMRHGMAERSQLDLVERHWRALAPPGALPHRRDLDAAALGAALPQAFTLEEVAPGVARIRVAGQRLHDWFGADPRGVPLSALFDDAGRPRLRDALLALFTTPALVEVAVATPRGALRAPIGGRLLLLPLQGEDGTITRAVGVFGLDQAPHPGPRRFLIPGEVAERVVPVVPQDPVRARLGGRAGAFPLPAPPAAAAPAFAERGKPFIRLVVSND